MWNNYERIKTLTWSNRNREKESKVGDDQPLLSRRVQNHDYDRRFNNIPDLTINLLCPSKNYSKLYGAESRFNNIRFNDIPGITMEI